MKELSEQFYTDLEKEIKPYFEGVNSCHDFSHTERVLNLALQLAKKEKASIDVIRLAVLLHDIARKEQDECKGEICHAERGAEIAKKILEELELEGEVIEKVVHCIETHRFRKDNLPETKEAMILYDADKLDSIGAIGILRACSFGGSVGAVVHNPIIEPDEKHAYTKEDSAYQEYLYKLNKIKDKMLTEEGRRIAEGRHKFMEYFFERVNKEVGGEL